MNPLVAEILEKHGTPERFARASTFVRQGLTMPFMYYLVSGKVKIEQSVVNGKSVLFSFTCADSWLGDLELFSDTELANSTVTAVAAPMARSKAAVGWSKGACIGTRVTSGALLVLSLPDASTMPPCR